MATLFTSAFYVTFGFFCDLLFVTLLELSNYISGSMFFSHPTENKDCAANRWSNKNWWVAKTAIRDHQIKFFLISEALPLVNSIKIFSHSLLRLAYLHHETTQCFFKQARDFVLLASERVEVSWVNKLLVVSFVSDTLAFTSSCNASARGLVKPQYNNGLGQHVVACPRSIFSRGYVTRRNDYC